MVKPLAAREINLGTIHDQRVTIMPDILLARRIRGVRS